MNYDRIAIILNHYPSVTETFICAELEMLNKYYPITVFALGKDSQALDKSELDVIYLPPSFLKILRSHVRYFFKHTAKYVSALFGGLRSRQPVDALKAFFQAVYFIPFIERNNVGHLHCHFANRPTDIAVALNRILGVPFSFSSHANDIYVNNATLADKIEKSIFVVTCTEYNRRYLCGLVNGDIQCKIHLNYHGLSLGKWNYGPSEGEFKMLSVGRLVEKKGYGIILDALAILNDAGHCFRYTIVGDGPLKEHLEKKARELGVDYLVDFAGTKTHEQMPDIYNAFHVLIHHSLIAGDGDRDGIPNVIFEAMASGTAVITTSVSGIPEITEGNCAIIVPPEDPRMLADAVLMLATDHSLRQTCVVNAVKKVKEFDSQIHHKRLRDIFDYYLNGIGGKPDTAE